MDREMGEDRKWSTRKIEYDRNGDIGADEREWSTHHKTK